MAKAAKAEAAGEGALPRKLVVHVDEGLASLDRAALAKDLKACAPKLPAPEFRGELTRAPGGPTLSFKAASSRVRDTRVTDEFYPVTSTEAEFETGIDAGPGSVPWVQLMGRLYDGNLVAGAALEAIPAKERDRSTLHMWVTRRLLGTYDPNDMRYHARFAVFAYPSVFSILGLALAPAPSVEATLMARELSRMGASPAKIEAQVDSEFPEERVDVDDTPTVTAAVASAILQAAARDAGNGPFCDDPKCRLYNAHRKREVRAAMLGGKMCAAHSRLFGSGGRGK